MQHVQRMPELVEEDVGVLPGQQHRRALLHARRRREARIHAADGQHAAAEGFGLAVLELVGAVHLARPVEQVEVDEADQLVAAARFVDAHARVHQRHTFAHALEAQAMHAAGGPEHRFQHGIEREMRLHLFSIEAEAFAAQPLGVVLAVPRREAEARRAGAVGLRIGELLVVGHLALGHGLHARPGAHEQRGHRLGRARHAVGQCVVGKARVAQQLGEFAAQEQHLGGEWLVVLLAGVVAAVRPHAPDLLAQIAAFSMNQERPHRAACIGDGPEAGPALLGGGGGSGLALRLGQACEPRLAFDEDGLRAGFVDEVLVVARGQRRDARIDLRQARLARCRQARATPAHAVDPHLGEAPRLGAEGALFACGPHRQHTREQAFVMRDLIVQCRQQRCDALRRGRHLAQALALAVHHVQAMHAPERAAAILQRFHGVLEGRRRRVGADGLHFGALHLERGEHRFFECGRSHAVEGRQAAIALE